MLNKSYETFGILLIVVGIFMMIFRDISFTKKEEVVDLGTLEINKKEKETLSWPVYTGVLATVAGVIILVAQRKKAKLIFLFPVLCLWMVGNQIFFLEITA